MLSCLLLRVHEGTVLLRGTTKAGWWTEGKGGETVKQVGDEEVRRGVVWLREVREVGEVREVRGSKMEGFWDIKASEPPSSGCDFWQGLL